jgi:GNAT superfamily N-acetyltransferase
MWASLRGCGPSTCRRRPISQAAVVSVGLLADYPHLIPMVGALRWREWGRPPEPIEHSWWVDITGREAGRENLPVTWVAMDQRGHALGAVGLGELDIEERRDRSPWVLGMVVEPRARGQGIGAQLMAALDAGVRQWGYERAWVATSGLAVRFYEKCGWRIVESFERNTGEPVTVLEKSL